MAIVRDLYWLTTNTDITRIENDGGGLAIYIGKASPGSSEGASKWQIQKLTYVSNAVTEINFANGSPAYAFSWTARASYSYS